MRGLVLIVATTAVTACSNDAKAGDAHPSPPRPDEPPTLLNTELPFHYPVALYARKAQGNVTLRLFVDANGRAVDESTRVYETSGLPPLDTAAITGSRALRFVPAKLHGEAIGTVVLLPVHFRHPEAPPLRSDSTPTSRRAKR
jgi:TonB family protein